MHSPFHRHIHLSVTSKTLSIKKTHNTQIPRIKSITTTTTFFFPESNPAHIQLMAIVRPFFCELKSQTPAIQKTEAAVLPKLRVADQPERSLTGNTDKVGKIVLQPRLCTLRTYGSDDRAGVIRSSGRGIGGADDVSRFFSTLSEYIESSKKTQDFEIISGRLAMIVFAATLTTEVVTGNSLFRKTDIQGITEAVGVCAGAVAGAAIFAYFSSARNKVGTIFTVRCNAFIDSLIDQIVDGLFFETEINDWSDDV